MQLSTNTPTNLMAFWLQNKSQCRSISLILAEARKGDLPGVAAGPLTDQFQITDKRAALDAMRAGKQS